MAELVLVRRDERAAQDDIDVAALFCSSGRCTAASATAFCGGATVLAAGPCVAAGRHAGIDYAHSLHRAIAEDPAGLVTLFRFTDTAWFDGAAAEGHCAILFGLLQRWGDRQFSRVLRAQKRPVRKAVFDALVSFPYFTPTEFPLTYASTPH